MPNRSVRTVSLKGSVQWRGMPFVPSAQPTMDPAVAPLQSVSRPAITLIARRTRDALRRHPWILDISDDPSIGPNAMRHFDQCLQALATLDVDFRDKLDLIMGGNLLEVDPNNAPADAGNGLWLKGDGAARFTAVSAQASGFSPGYCCIR